MIAKYFVFKSIDNDRCDSINLKSAVSPSYGAAVRVEEASHADDNQVLKERQASHDDVGNPLICRLHSQPARNAECRRHTVNGLSTGNKAVCFNQVITLILL